MRMNFIAALLLSLVMCYADMLFAQADSIAAEKSAYQKRGPQLSWRKDKKIAKKLLKKNATATAIPYLEDGQKKKPKKKYFAEKLAPAYLEVRDYLSSNKWYKVLIDKDSVEYQTTANLFYYALTQKYLGQYEQSIASFIKFKKGVGDDDESLELRKRVTREVHGSLKGIFFRDSMPNPAFKVKRLDANVNQPSADYAPRLRDNILYYSSQKGDSSFSKIYRSPRLEKNWGAVEPLSDNINAAGLHTGNGSFSEDGNTLYYTECRTDDLNKLKCRIYRSKYTDGAWEKGMQLGPTINAPLYTSTQPAVGLNKDGEDVLYFVSDRNPGKGLDIFYARINPNGTFGKPHSVGPQINSKGDEMSPYFDFNTKTLYFSSNGWISIGGQDVFKSTWDANGEWTEAQNMGTPINSSADDIGFYINDQGLLGFVASNRPASAGPGSETCCDNIYQVETARLFLSARGNVYEEKDSARTIADHGIVLLYDENNGTELGSYNLISGGYFFDLAPKVSYKLVTREDGYYDGVTSFNTNDNTENDTLKYDLFLKKKPDHIISPLLGRVIGRVYYDLDQPRLRADSHDSLNSVLSIMDQNPGVIVEVGGHTDGVGPVAYNMELSQMRAEEVMNYLVHDKKVSNYRLTARAYGPSQPVAPDFTPDGKDNLAGQALNRRTEFKVIGELTPEHLAIDAAKRETNEKPANVIKKDLYFGKPAAPSKPAVTAPSTAPDAGKLPAAADTGYKTAPLQPQVVTGPVSPDKGEAHPPVNQASVFVPTKEGGFKQKIKYIKDDKGYSFDLSPATVDSLFKVIGERTAAHLSINAAKRDTNEKPANVIKKDIYPANPPATMSSVTTPATTPAIIDAGYKNAPLQPLVVTGLVYLDKGGTRTLVDQAAVFLTTNEGGFTQKVYYVKVDGGYSFDLSHAAADTFKLVARKYQFESDEIVFTGIDIRKANKPINLVIKAK
jgi:outer membrane protein OmpA-like peptidoglycan-associated protein